MDFGKYLINVAEMQHSVSDIYVIHYNAIDIWNVSIKRRWYGAPFPYRVVLFGSAYCVVTELIKCDPVMSRYVIS